MRRLKVVIECSGRDMLRIWPLPVEEPWLEDGGAWPGRRWDRTALNTYHESRIVPEHQ